MNQKVYTLPGSLEEGGKFQAINLTRTTLGPGKSTVEFRALDPQRNPEEFLRQIKLFEKRIAFLKKNKKLVLDTFTTMTPQEKVNAFRGYVEEVGLKWEDYAPLVRNTDPELLAKAISMQINVWEASQARYMLLRLRQSSPRARSRR